MKEQLFFVDAETDGLYGRFLSVAALVTDRSGNEIDRFYGAVRVNFEDINNTWVKNNVYPHLEKAYSFFQDEKALLESFWIFWLKYREKADCVAYIPFPVESRLFETCVMHDVDERQFLGPFPIYDLATLLESESVNFDGDIKSLSGLDLCNHDAMDDVIMLSAVWIKLF